MTRSKVRAGDGAGVSGAGVSGVGVSGIVAGSSATRRRATGRETEVLPDVVEGAWLAAIEAEAQPEDLPLALVETREEPGHVVDQHGGGRVLVRRWRRAVRDHVAQLRVAPLDERFGE